MAVDPIRGQHGRQDIRDDDGQAKLLVPRLLVERQETPLVHHRTQQVRQRPKEPVKNPPLVPNPPKNIQDHQGPNPTL